MTISSSTRKAGPYTGNGVTTSFSFSFKVFQASDLEVVRTNLSGVESILVLGTDYTVTLNSNQNSNPGGSITATTAPASGFKITITSNIAYTQALDLTNQGGFYPTTINDALDRTTIQIQQLNEQVSRAAKLPISNPTDADALTADLVRLADSADNIDIAANNIDAIIAAPDEAAAAAASAALANDWATKTSGPVAGGEYSAKYNAQQAASSATSASTSASNADTSAINAASSATAAATSASSASTSATSASTSATTASTKASEASTSATNAASSASSASSSASAASTSATNAANSASAASTSATNAASSATAAAGSATSAATSATNASNSAATAVRYIGPASSNPTTRNDGSALQSGDLYFNTVALVMRVYNGTTWQDQAASPDTMTERHFLATAGQTTYAFSGGYRVGYTYIWVNGAMLYDTDYTATDGANITFASALALNDEVKILSIKAVGTIAIADISGLQTALDAKQATLVSGANIKTINGSSLLGSGDIAAGASVVRSARTSNTILAAADKGTLIDITSGTFTQTFTAAATLGSGWYCYIRNSGTGDITLDPNGSETIDGLTSYVMYPGEVRLVQCDGTAFYSVVLNAFAKTFTASGTFTKPPGYSYFKGMLWGGGAGAKWGTFFDGSNTNYYKMPGGGGGCMPIQKRASDLAASESVTIGAGGVRTTVYNSSSNNGGDSVFAGITALGGRGGSGGGTRGSASASTGGDEYAAGIYSNFQSTTSIPFVGSVSLINTSSTTSIPGFALYGGGCAGGLAGQTYDNTFNCPGGFSYYGGGGGACLSGARGNSIYGGRGADASNAAEAPGGGGHGSSSATNGNGARGELRIWGVI